MTTRLPELESSLASITVPFGVLVGELSPMPPSAGVESAERIPGAWSQGLAHGPSEIYGSANRVVEIDDD